MTTAPLIEKFQINTASLGAATDFDYVVCNAPWAGTVTAVSYTPQAAITGTATNYRRLELENRGTAGSGTTVVASIDYDGAAVSTSSYDEQALTIITASATVAAGDVLAWVSTSPGTGMADPGGTAEVQITRTTTSA